MEAVDMPSERFWQNAPDMNSMTKTVSSQLQKERGFEGEVEEYLEEQPMNSLLYSIALNYSRPKKKPFPFDW